MRSAWPPGIDRCGHRLELSCHFSGRLRPVPSVLCQAAHHEVRQSRWRCRPERCDVWGILDRVRDQHRLHVSPGEGCTTAEHLVRHRAKRVQVHAVVGCCVARRLFRRHVRRSAERSADRGHGVVRERGAADRLRDAEVGHYGRVPGQEHVVGLDVAMRDALGVRVLERSRNVAQDRDRLRYRQLAVRQSLAQRLALDVRHPVIREAVDLSRGNQRTRCRGWSIAELRRSPGGSVRSRHRPRARAGGPSRRPAARARLRSPGIPVTYLPHRAPARWRRHFQGPPGAGPGSRARGGPRGEGESERRRVLHAAAVAETYVAADRPGKRNEEPGGRAG